MRVRYKVCYDGLMYVDSDGQTHEHNHGAVRGGVAGCPECKARNRDSLRRRRLVNPGRVKQPGKNLALKALGDEARLTRKRAQQMDATNRYRATHGRLHGDYLGLKTPALRADWLRRGIDPAVCFYCPAPAEHADHYFPRARGGSDEFHNLVPACAPCNYRKNDKLPIEWLATRLAAS